MTTIVFDLQISPLTALAAETNIDSLMRLDAAAFGANVAWRREHFLWTLPGKWELSAYAEAGGNLCGYVVASLTTRRVAHIHRIAVDTSVRGTGLGRHLVGYVERSATSQGCSELTLEFAKQLGVDGFYGRLGFQEMCDQTLEAYLRAKSRLDEMRLYTPPSTAQKRAYTKPLGKPSC